MAAIIRTVKSALGEVDPKREAWRMHLWERKLDTRFLQCQKDGAYDQRRRPVEERCY